MTDYSLWEVILNGDSPAPIRVIEGSSSESLDQIHDRLQKLISQLEILGVSLSQEDINLKFLRRLPTDWRTHTLIWRNKTDLEEQSLDDLFNILRSMRLNTNEPISAAVSVSAVSAKIPVSALPNVDSLIRARRFLQRTGRNLRANRPTSIGFDMSKVECYNCHKKGHFVRNCRSPKDTRRNDEEPTNYALMAFTSSSSSSDNESDESFPPSPIYDRYQSGNGYHVIPPPYSGTFMPPKPDLVFHNNNETDHTAFNVELSPIKPENDLSHTHRPSSPNIEDWVSDSEDEFATKISQNVPSFVQPTEQVKSPRHSVQHIETSILAANPKTASPKPKSTGNNRNRKACFRLVVPTAVLTQSKLVPITAVRLVTTVVPKPTLTRPRQAKTIVPKLNSPPKRHINRTPSPKASNFPLKVTAVKAPMVNVVQDVQGKWEWKP
nr:phytoalexin-deficient 4-2 protein [Tanacetum cinerariifolium]